MSQCVHFLGACADFRDSTAVFRLNYHSVVDVTLRTSDLQRRVFEDERAYKSHRVFVHKKSNAVVFGGSVMREYGVSLHTSVKGMQVHTFIFQALPKSFDTHVIHPPTFAIH